METKMTMKSGEAVDSVRAPGLFLFLLVFVLWLLLAGALNPQELIAGGLVAMIVTLVSRPHLDIFSGLRLTPTAILPFLSYQRKTLQ